MSSNPAFELASTLQAAHIKHDPDPQYDVNPSTAASKKSPVRFRSSSPLAADDIDDVDDEAPDAHLTRSARRRAHSYSSTAPSGEIPVSALEPPARQVNFPPIPDLRFEQTYLARIKDCKTWYSVAWWTFYDHVMTAVAQGFAWNILIFGWRAWNDAAKFHGHGVGAKIRRWWWSVNNWIVPQERGAT